jgi:glucosamine--fructose-6-phosphate aminotransferase (isomerizing)
VIDGRLTLDELRISDDVLREVTKVFVVACGTAFHSGLVAKYAIEHWTRLPVEIEIASEFRYRDPVLGPDTLTLAVSQSGETIDTLEAARHARRQGSQVIAVTNTVGSSLAREADGVLYTHAGPEICVAATKTFATQMVSQYLVALYLAQVRGTSCPRPWNARSPSTAAAASWRGRCRTRRPGCSSGGTPAIPPRWRARSS